MKRRDKPGKQDREQQPRRRKDMNLRPDKQPKRIKQRTEHREINPDRDNPKVNKRRNHRSERKEQSLLLEDLRKIKGR